MLPVYCGDFGQRLGWDDKAGIVSNRAVLSVLKVRKFVLYVEGCRVGRKKKE